MKRAIINSVLILFLLSMTGCSKTTLTLATLSVDPRFPNCPTGPLTLGNPLVVTSIGVNQYANTAGEGVSSKPAHLLSAAIFHEPFKVAAERTKQQARNLLAFKSRSTVVLDGLLTPIEQLVFNADGSEVAATSKGGDAGVWRLAWMSESESPSPTPRSNAVYAVNSRIVRYFLNTTTQSNIKHVGFVKYLGAEALLFIDDHGYGEITKRDGKTTLDNFRHPGPVRYMEVDAKGSRILTVGVDSTVRIWNVSNLLNPAQLTTEGYVVHKYNGEDELHAVFSNDGESVLVTNCEGVWLYSVHDPNHPTFNHILPTDSFYKNLVEVSRDGRFFVWTNYKGELHYQRMDSNESLTISGPNIGFAIAKPTISRDGKVVAQPLEDGSVSVWRERDNQQLFKQQPLVLAADRSFDQVFLSGSGEEGVGISKYAVFAWDLRVWDEQDEALGLSDLERRVIPSLLLHSFILHQGRKTSDFTTTVIDPLGEKVAIGFKSGRIELYGARTSPKIESLASVSLVADNWLPLEAENEDLRRNFFDPTLYGLRYLGGDVVYKAKYGLPPEMTLQKIRNSISTALDNAKRVYKQFGSVVLIVYMSGHGWIGQDGEPYFLPGDANKSDSASWISYSSVVREIEGFVENNPKKRAVVIFDTCQTQSEKAVQPVRQVKTTSPYVTVVQSASPGQYAWHYGAASSVSGYMSKMKDTSLLPTKTEEGKIEADLDFYISVLPLASKCYLSGAVEQLRETQATLDKTDEKIRGVNLSNWLSGVKEYALQILEHIAECTELKKRFGTCQDIQLDISKESGNIAIFLIGQE